MKQSLTRSLHSSNLKQKEQHCDLDNVHTLGIASMKHAIGVSSLHFIDALQPDSYKDLLFSLSRKAGQQIKCDKAKLLLLCKQVIFESAITKCKDCRGVSHHIVNHKVVHCPTCNGTGLNRHSDRERSKAMNISEEEYFKHWSNRFQLVQSIYTGECRNAMRIAYQVNEK